MIDGGVSGGPFRSASQGTDDGSYFDVLSEYPDDPARLEARYLMGTNLLRMGDEDGAKANLTSCQRRSKGFYGRRA